MKTLLSFLFLLGCCGSMMAQSYTTRPISSASTFSGSSVTTTPVQQGSSATVATKPSTCHFNINNFYFGGGLGLNLGSNSTDIIIQPLVGYRFTPILSAGLLFDYEYTTNKSGFSDYTANTIGGGIFSQADIPVIPNKLGLAIHVEYDYLHRMIDANGISSSNNDSYLPSGVGLFTYAGRSRISVLALWDLLHLDNDNAGTPTLRVSATF